jgi:hypothetical protein
MLNKKAFALANGILWAIAIFVATIYVLVKGGGNTVILLQQFFWGYNISFGGAILGLIYGFVWGFIYGWIFGFLYNRFAGKKENEVKI